MKTIIIGGGAAGMASAVAAAKSGQEVLLLEQNEKLGKKVFITGKGRCNVTNACDSDAFYAHVISNPKFLYSAYSAFDCRDLMKLIEENGTPLKTERGDRVFPVSDHSWDIIDAFKTALKKANVTVRLHSAVSEILTNDTMDEESGKSLKSVSGVKLKSGEIIKADKVIVATGGKSYPSTGSTGDGYVFAKKLGHTVKDLKPALVPLETKEEWVPSLQGLSLKNTDLSLFVDGKKKYTERGEMLFTHFGISGPMVLSASSILAGCREYKEAYVLLDLKPALSEEEFDKRLIRELAEGNRKELKNILNNIYPSKFASLICEIAGVDEYKKCCEVNKEDRQKLLSFSKKLKITITKPRDFNEAIITHGGINVKEINPKTMESKLVKGLYFAGEVMDLDAFTGGFNLQIAFSTGTLAGRS